MRLPSEVLIFEHERASMPRREVRPPETSWVPLIIIFAGLIFAAALLVTPIVLLTWK